MTLASEIFTYSLKDEGHQTALGSPGLTGSFSLTRNQEGLEKPGPPADHALRLIDSPGIISLMAGVRTKAIWPCLAIVSANLQHRTLLPVA